MRVGWLSEIFMLFESGDTCRYAFGSFDLLVLSVYQLV